LNVVPIRTPPLRERQSDIPALAHHLVKNLPPGEIRVKQLSPQALLASFRASWPGKRRQLENSLEAASR